VTPPSSLRRSREVVAWDGDEDGDEDEDEDEDGHLGPDASPGGRLKSSAASLLRRSEASWLNRFAHCSALDGA
jgi:hypothetical protein